MHISGISGLRGCSILLIVFYHLNQIRPIENLSEWNWELYQFIELLPVVVSVFFILSGLLRSLSYWKVLFEGGEIPPFWSSMKDRFFRIAPLFYGALILSFFWSYREGFVDWKSFFVGFTFFSWVHPETFFPVAINGPLWFVAYDMMGNITVMLFMAFLILLARKYHRVKHVLIPLTFIVGIAFLLFLHFLFVSLPFVKLDGIVSIWFPYYNPFIFGVYYLFGAILGGGVIFLSKKQIKPSLVFDLLGIFALCSICFFLLKILGASDLEYSFPVSPFRFPLIPFLFGVSIFSIIFSRYLARLFDNRIFLFLGEISYPLFLFHALLLVIIRELFFPELLSFRDWGVLSVLVITSSILLSRALMKGERVLMKKWKKHEKTSNS